MGVIQNFTTLIRETLNLNGHIDTAAAERSIRNNIEFKGPNAWILANSADSIAISDLEELKEWLKVRLDTEIVEVSQRKP